ncbi:hypothetical protein [Pseudomonas sp. zfem005]|uniref:hypothetical protein n=1 Tax=Pseudomonas sp. zfem005 TaxID=3078200 RepID=UPI00292753E2|nr:hypothetical protein [Pseudomonas sp. zfem005]MDU9416439.1 hypothetical protein [Pseudomonas sp. zfem005]
MTQYNRPNETVFASGAKPGELESFPDIARGWGIAFDQTDGIPPMEWFNSLFKRSDEAVRYLLQRGISEWSATEDYPVGAYVQESGKLWRCIAANTAKRPTLNAAFWDALKVTKSELDEAYASQAHTHSFSSITNKPTSVDGYGIQDGVTFKSIGLPFHALSLPVVATDDGRVLLTAQAATGAGGKVVIPAGLSLSLAAEVDSTKTGIPRTFLTVAWSSPDLAVNSEYFLRAQVINSLLSIYVQKGKLSDTTPVSLKGTANAESGGGFPSTVLDVCLARIVTGAAGSVPLVQRIYHRKSSSWTVSLNGTGTLYLPMDPHVKTASGSASCLMPPESGLAYIIFSGSGWAGTSSVYGVPGNTAVTTEGFWNSSTPMILSSNGAVGDVFQSSINAGFEHASARSMWQSYQVEHTYGSQVASSDELLLSMGIKALQSSDYENGIAVSYSNCTNAVFTWSVYK